MTPSLYVHIPFCTQKCDYCDFFSKPIAGKVPDSYINALLHEAEFHARKFGISGWKTIYIGGGTPGLLSPEQISFFFRNLSPRVTQHVEEITMEMNPESVTEEKIHAAKSAGVTRLSLGIQSFNDTALKAVNRRCTAKKARESVSLIKSIWNGKLNLDCIAGLPAQDKNQFMQSLEEIISFEPDHISLYALTVEEGTPLHEKIQEKKLDYDYDAADEQWIYGRNLLKKNGFTQYEVSNFSRPGKESRHNMTYWMQKNYVGIGAGATGTIYGTESFRWTNAEDIEKYASFWNSNFQCEREMNQHEIPRSTEKIDLKTKEFEFLMMGLRTSNGINSEEYKKRFSKVAPWNGNLEERIGAKNGTFEKFRRKNLTLEKKCSDGSISYSLNSEGLLLLNRFLVEL